MVAKPANSINLNSSAGVVSWDGVKTISTSSVNQYAIIVGSTSQGISNISPSAMAGIPLISNGGSANPSFSTAVVAGGGTGVTTMTTAYAPVCAGTTATGALQVASTGLSTSGWVLTSTGASSLPTFQAPSVTASVAIQRFVYTGGAQTYTPTTNMKYCIIEVVGGGGAGGGCGASGSNQVACAGGGGGGGYARIVASAATIGGSQSVTIGAGGTAGTAGNNPGNAGGTTSVGSIVSATGGSGGGGTAANAGSVTNGGGGGAGSNGNFNTTGSPGGTGYGASGYLMSGIGGSTFFGGGGLPKYNGAAGAGNAGTSYGGGGSGGAINVSSSAVAGGAGSAGIVVITEYI